MRPAPAVSVQIRPSRAVRLVIASLVASALYCLAYGVGARCIGSDAASRGAAVLAGASAIAAYRRPGVRSGRLRWASPVWTFETAPTAGRAGTACDGELAVMLDTGAWMLLRFTPTDPAALDPATPPMSRRSPFSSPQVYLPVGFAGDAAAWHALRCAVYSPRPAGMLGEPDPPSSQASRSPGPPHDFA